MGWEWISLIKETKGFNQQHQKKEEEFFKHLLIDKMGLTKIVKEKHEFFY
jgi:hypothetical protein